MGWGQPGASASAAEAGAAGGFGLVCVEGSADGFENTRGTGGGFIHIPLGGTHSPALSQENRSDDRRRAGVREVVRHGTVPVGMWHQNHSQSETSRGA